MNQKTRTFLPFLTNESIGEALGRPWTYVSGPAKIAVIKTKRDREESACFCMCNHTVLRLSPTGWRGDCTISRQTYK